MLKMPRSRNSRSSSPLKSLKTTTGQSEYDRIFQNVQEMFSDTVDADVIYLVLTECHWRSEEAIDKLLTIVEKSEAQPIKTKSKLHEIAEGVLGPLRQDECQEQGHTHPGANQTAAQASTASVSFERTIGRPVSSKENNHEEHKALFQRSSSPSPIGLQARGGLGQPVTNALPPGAEKGLHPVSSAPVLAWDFPLLSKDSSNDVKLDSDNFQPIKSSESKNESWRAIKAPKSSRHSSNSPQQNLENESDSLQSGLMKLTGQDKGDINPVRQRLEMNRNFPVRLLSKSPDEVREKITFPETMHHSVSESVLSKKNRNIEVAQPESFELDETVIRCITEINHEILDETEKKTDRGLFGRSRSGSVLSQASENESGGTGCSTPDPSHVRTSTPSNLPMTLPVIGLSVEAPEFVPRPKKTKTEEIAQSSSETVAVTSSTRSSPLSSAPLKVETKATPIPIRSPHQAIHVPVSSPHQAIPVSSPHQAVPVSPPHQGLSPIIRIGSPRIAVVSPGCAISPPSNVSVTNSAHLTGSPMFITPKWQPVFPGIYSPQQPPPPLQPRLVAQQLPQHPQQFPPSFRFSPPGTQFPPYSRVMYPVGARPVFRVAGMPPRLSQVPMPQVVTEVNDIVAMATGQPIMATRESVHPGRYPASLEGQKSTRGEMQQSLEVCVETVRALSKAGKKIMVIVRGLPGSGKSTLARAIKFDGVVLSTDDYFTKGDMYEYDPDKLTEAHQWNRERAKEAIKMGTSPIVIDNTNTQKWEFKPYVSMALNNSYYVEIMEPDTPWKFKPKELAKRTIHGVPEDQIERMLSRYEKNLTVAVVSNNKPKKPVTNGSADPQLQNNSFRKENSLSPALERKPIKSAKSEAARRSRSRGKSNKLRDLKSTRKIQTPSSNSPVLGNSDVIELQEWQISEDDKMWERQTLSPNSVHSVESANTSLIDEWTTDDWTEIRNEKTEDENFNNSETVQNFETKINSNLMVAPSSDLSTSSQGEISFYPHHSDIPSITSSKTASPIIEYNVLESYNNQSNHHSDTNLSSKLEEKILYQTERKSLKDIETELSEEVLGYVNEVMEEHSSMNTNELSKEDRDRIEEELKAFLQFYTIEDEEQRRKAEILIGLKLNETEIEKHSYMETEEKNYEPYYVEENAEMFMPAKQIATEYNENVIAQAVEHVNDLKDVTSSLKDKDTERTTDVSLDLDSSLNKEVANILNGLNLDKETTSIEKNENTILETTCNDYIMDNLTEIGNEESNMEYNILPVQETMDEKKEINSKCSLELTEGVKSIEKTEEIIYPFEEEFQSIHQPQDFSNSLESAANKRQVQESIYDIDSAIIRAETSEFVETDSLFENDSAIIAASTDSMERDSLYDTDSAIIAVSTDVMDTDSLYETDSAIIAASTDLGDSDIAVEDADIMKRLKASVEELKYWGHIETSEEVSVDAVATEWDVCHPNISDQWQNEISSVFTEAKPQRQKRLKSGLYNGVENDLSKLETNAEHIENRVNQKEEICISDSNTEADLSNINTPLENDHFEASQPLNDVNTCDLIYQGNPEENSFSLSCYNNNKEIGTNSFNDPSEAVNFAYSDNKDLGLTQYENEPANLHDPNQNREGKAIGDESELPIRTSETDLENAIFISDDEDILNESLPSKANSDGMKTENSDDNIFVSDDDMEYLNTNLKVDGLQTIAIQEEIIANSKGKPECRNMEEEILSTNNGQENEVEIDTIVPDLNSHSVELTDNIETAVTENLSCEIGVTSEKDSDTVDKAHECTSSGDLIVNDLDRNTETATISLQPCPDLNIEKDMSGLKLCEAGSGYSLQTQPSPKKRKPSKSRMAAKLSKPFFDISDTEKFVSNDWSTFSSPFDSINIIKPSNTDNLVERNNFKSEGTLTESGDFRVLNLYSQGETLDYVHEYQLVKTRSRSIDMDDEHLVKSNVEPEKTTISDIRRIDKSCSTADLEKDQDNENVQFLKTCFPNISENELDCVLLNCVNNVEWALNLLLDWKYHLDFTDEEKENFVREISKCKRCPSPEISDTNNESFTESNPDSLLDLCFKKIEKDNIADREDLEKQIIQTGKERLDRIEDDNITKIRMRRSTSLSESSFDANRSGVSASHSCEKVRRSISDPHQNFDSVFVNSATKFDEKGHLSKGFQISPVKIMPERTLKQHRVLFDETFKSVGEKNSGDEFIGDNVDELTTSGVVPVNNSVRDGVNNKTKNELHHNATAIITEPSLINDSAIEEQRDIDQLQENHVSNIERGRLSSTPEPVVSASEESVVVFSLALDGNVISQLEYLFGPVGDHSITEHGDLEVPINIETARLLHHCVRNGLQDGRHAQYKQLKEDEEYARRLQEEQDLSDSRNNKQNYQSPSKVHKREPVKPLAEIMEEEMTRQTAREELQKSLVSEGSHAAIATRMKRQKLYEIFPTIDTTLLDQIFQANCYNLTETMESVQSSLSYQPVQNVMTKEMEEKYDRQLMHSIKQQSALDVLDTFDYSLSEDCDDIVDAGFEDYRGEATLHHKLRQECFQKAQEAYRKGLKQVASFYSQQGHLHTQKLKEADMRASEQILEDRHSDLETKMTLDLHGLHVDEAVAALDKILPEKEREKYKSHLIIVTGRGRHSHHGVPRLRPAVLAYLQKHQYSFTELHPGAFRVTLKNR